MAGVLRIGHAGCWLSGLDPCHLPLLNPVTVRHIRVRGSLHDDKKKTTALKVTSGSTISMLLLSIISRSHVYLLIEM